MKTINFTIVMTEMCNFACKYCYVCSEDKTEKISTESIDDIILFLETYILENKDHSISISLFGGEPLIAFYECKYFLNKFKAAIIEKHLSQFTTCFIFTNMSLLTTDILDWIKAYNDNSGREYVKLNLSLDGCKEINDASRVFKNGKGTFDTIMQKVDLLSSYMRKERMVFKAVISPDNCFGLLSSAKYFYEHGFKRVSFCLARTSYWTDESIEILKTSLRELGDFLIEHIDDGVWYDIFAIPILDEDYCKTNNGFCGAGKTMYTIGLDNNIYPCQRFYNNRSPFIIGDIKNGFDHKSVWYNFFKSYTLNSYIKCSNCEKFPKHNCPYGSCIASNYEETGNMLSISDMVCKCIVVVTEESYRINHILKDNHNYQTMMDKNKYGG